MNSPRHQSSKETSCDLTSQFLCGNVTDDTFGLLEEHLGKCAACREKVETESVSSEFWTETRIMLGEPEPVYTLPRRNLDLASVLDAPLFSCDSIANESESGGVFRRDATLKPLDFGGGSILSRWLDPTSMPDSLGRLGKYEILRVIGQGGMGLVVEAVDTELHRHVAIKTIGNLLTDSEQHQRLIREARTIAALRHPHILPIYGIDKWREVPVLVMPLIRGGTLQHAVASGDLTIDQVLCVGTQVAKALTCLHEHGVVHRDLKPSNILLNDDLQNVVLSDFGLARADHDFSLTGSNVVVGTPHFMSPEQSRGERLDYRSDLFSLGSLLFWLCTGQLPFAGSSQFAIMNRVVCQDPDYRLLSERGIPKSIQLLIQGLLAKKPDQRWQTSRQVLELLESCRNNLSHDDLNSNIPIAFVDRRDGHNAQAKSNRPLSPVSVVQSSQRWRNFLVVIGATIAIGGIGLVLSNFGIVPWNSTISEQLQSPEINPTEAGLTSETTPRIQLVFPEVRADRQVALDELDRQVIIEELKSGRNALYWLRRLASLPVDELPAEVLPIVQEFSNHPHPTAKQLAEVILDKNPFQDVGPDHLSSPKSIEWHSTENPFVEIKVEETKNE